MLKKLAYTFIVLFGFAINTAPLQSQGDGAVYAILFYSPTCPHCHQLITDTLPPIQDQFGDQLIIFFVDVSTENGSTLAQAAYNYYQIPRDQWVVPMMIVNEQVLIGGAQIPSQLPIITQMGVEQGGISVPQFPMMQVAFQRWQADISGTSATDEVMPAESVSAFVAALEHDSLAVLLTVAILIGLIVSGIGLVVTQRAGIPIAIPQLVILGITLVTFVIALTLALAEQHDGWALPIALIVLMSIMLGSALAVFGDRIQVAVALFTVAGLVIAVYMAYVELTTHPAVCGAIGDCNAVQQSEYASLLGIPIGLIGVVGYVLMFGISLLLMRAKFTENMRWLRLLRILVGLSAVFTIYLTFLEPFVIGAVCAWCLMSSLVVLNLMWLVMPKVHTSKQESIQYLLYQPA